VKRDRWAGRPLLPVARSTARRTSGAGPIPVLWRLLIPIVFVTLPHEGVESPWGGHTLAEATTLEPTASTLPSARQTGSARYWDFYLDCVINRRMLLRMPGRYDVEAAARIYSGLYPAGATRDTVYQSCMDALAGDPEVR
jgi:hypothetical protein